MAIQPYLSQILAELQATLGQVADEPADELFAAILNARRIFVAGAGRSGLAMRGFAMRLMHLGLPVHVAGETTTPGITAADLLLIGSASGGTGTMVTIAGHARQAGARVALVTLRANSPLAQLADPVLVIPASTPTVPGQGGVSSAQPMGNLFEQSMWLTLDALIMKLMTHLNITSEAMYTRHANLE